MSLQMLKKRLTAILPVVRHDRELLLRHCKLERYVEDALWRMQVVLGGQDGDDDSECYFSRRPATAVTPARVRIPKTWLAQLQPSVLLFYADKNNRSPGVRQKQKRRQRRQSRRSQSSSSSKKTYCEPQLIPKLLSEPWLVHSSYNILYYTYIHISHNSIKANKYNTILVLSWLLQCFGSRPLVGPQCTPPAKSPICISCGTQMKVGS